MTLQNFADEATLAYLRAAAAELTETEEQIALYRAYYSGEQGIEMTTRQKEYLSRDDIDIDSFGNICPRVVAIPTDRMRIEPSGITAADPDAAEYADAVTGWWEANRLTSKQVELYQAIGRDGGIAVIVGWDGEKPTFTPNLLYDGTTGLIRFHYDSDGRLLFASKRYRLYDSVNLRESGTLRMTLYYPDRIERYQADSNQAGGWRPLQPAELDGLPNPQPWTDWQGRPLGIPVIHFESPFGSELTDIMVMQKMLNHNLGTLDEAIDQQAFPLLWASNLSLPIDTVTGKASVPSYGPGQMFLTGDGGNVGRIEPADIERMFRGGVLSWVQVAALVKGWPYYLFDRSAQAPSGVSLKIMESSLIAQIKAKQQAINEAWLDAFNIGRRLHRLNTGQELTGEIAIKWQSVETEDILTQAQANQIKWQSASIPVITRWRELGYTQDQIDQMIQDARLGDNEMLNAETVTGVSQ